MPYFTHLKLLFLSGILNNLDFSIVDYSSESISSVTKHSRLGGVVEGATQGEGGCPGQAGGARPARFWFSEHRATLAEAPGVTEGAGLRPGGQKHMYRVSFLLPNSR